MGQMSIELNSHKRPTPRGSHKASTVYCTGSIYAADQEAERSSTTLVNLASGNPLIEVGRALFKLCIQNQKPIVMQL
jgi:hypothetical protein